MSRRNRAMVPTEEPCTCGHGPFSLPDGRTYLYRYGTDPTDKPVCSWKCARELGREA